MTAEHVRVVGMPEAMADMRRWVDQLPAEVVKAGDPFSQQVADRVEWAVPVLTGQLAASVTTANDSDGLAVGYDGTADYAGWIEFGGSRGRQYMSEGRYLFPQAVDATDEFVKVASDAATDSAVRFAWSKAH